MAELRKAMEKRLATVFNEKVEEYRNILVSCAGKSEWETFKTNAGRLFDFVESIELSELERRFFGISKVIMFILFVMVVLIFRMNLDINPAILKARKLIVLMSVAGCSYQLYFYLNFRMYIVHKMTSYKKRRERFIRNIENDFKTR